MNQIAMLQSEFTAWAESVGFRCYANHNGRIYGSLPDGSTIRVGFADDGIPLRRRYVEGWERLVEPAQAIEDRQCDASELDGLFGWEGGML